MTTSPIPLREELLAGWDDHDDDDAGDRPGHACVAYRESATYPESNGHIVVTEHCHCGRIVNVYNDSIM